MKDPDDYLSNSPPPLPPTPAPLCVVPWLKHEQFLICLDMHGMGTLERWMNAPEEVHAIFHMLLSYGLHPWVAAELFMSSYCAPPGTYRVDLEPDFEPDVTPTTAPDCHDEDPGPCSVVTCPKHKCPRHPTVGPLIIPDVPGIPINAMVTPSASCPIRPLCPDCINIVSCRIGRNFLQAMAAADDAERHAECDDDED